jgi:hypothetical protein
VGITLEQWTRLRTYLSEDFLGGPRVLKMNWVINFQKGGTLPFVLGLMALTDTWTVTAWTYLALHGSYGLIWLLKDVVMPDARWQTRITLGGALMTFALVLGPYWLAPILLVASDTQQPPWLLACATIAYALGAVLMMASDGQKHFTLQHRRGLITTGWFARDAATFARVAAVMLGEPIPETVPPAPLLLATDAFALADEAVQQALAPADLAESVDRVVWGAGDGVAHELLLAF